MEDYSLDLLCTACGRSYRVALRKMRANAYNICPACGFRAGIAQEEAMKAQRLLERLELGEKLGKVA